MGRLITIVQTDDSLFVVSFDLRLSYGEHIISEIIEKGVDGKYERTIEILRNSSGEDAAEQRMREEFGISRAAARAILDSPLRCNIIGEAQDYLELLKRTTMAFTHLHGTDTSGTHGS